MSRPTPEISLFTLHVDAADTIQAVLDAGDVHAGVQALSAFLQAISPGTPLSTQCTDPDGTLSVHPTAVSTVDDVLAALATTGFAATRTAWREGGTDAYLSEGRILTVLPVAQSFAAYLTDDRAAGDQPIASVPAGWYLIGEVGDVVPALVGVTGVPAELTDSACMGEVTERVTMWAVEVESFGASRCDARCSTCGGRWYAESGSWQFASETGDANWSYDDAYGFEGSTIACSACAAGRVGFAVS